jgi:hypothetical protein
MSWHHCLTDTGIDSRDLHLKMFEIMWKELRVLRLGLLICQELSNWQDLICPFLKAMITRLECLDFGEQLRLRFLDTSRQAVLNCGD